MTPVFKEESSFSRQILLCYEHILLTVRAVISYYPRMGWAATSFLPFGWMGYDGKAVLGVVAEFS